MSNQVEIQKAFFERIKASIPDEHNLSGYISDLLKLSMDSTYRRMRGEKALSLDEICILCSHFKVSFEVTHDLSAEYVPFKFKRLEGKRSNFKRWLSDLGNDLEMIASVKGSSFLYAADDVPIWHHFFDHRMISFKLFYWLKCIVADPEYANANFTFDIIDQEMITLAEKIYHRCNQISSTEVWTEDTFNSTLKQVEYFWESGFFHSKEDALLVCDLIGKEIDNIQQQASLECKPDSIHQFKMYRSEVMVGNNSILVEVGKTKIAYISNNTFNMISSMDPEFVTENNTWLNNLIKKSIQISGVAEKQRNQFFRIFKLKLEELKGRIV